MMKPRTVIALVVRLVLPSAASLLSACVQLPDFEEGSIVKSPRVLAVVAEPPEIAPGEALDLSILIAGVEDREGMQITWRACGAFDGFFGGGGAQYGEEEADEGCGGGLAFELGEGETAQLPGVLTADLFDNLDVIAMTLGSELPEDIIDQIRSSVGLAFLIEATVRADGKMIRATKRVLLSENPEPHSNPPTPSFMLGEQAIGIASGQPMQCARTDGELATLPADVDVDLIPLTGSEDQADPEGWLEMFNVINARGELRERTERAFYSWYATAGELNSGITKSPLRNNIWHTPTEPGVYPLWLIVRDGHGGASACELAITIE